MPAGLQVWNASSTIQITDSYANLVFKEKRTLTLSGGGGTVQNPRSATFTVNSANPLLAFGAGGMACLTNRSQVSAGVWSYTVHCPASSLVVYIFDTVVPAAGSYGLQVFKADGSLAYDSTHKYAKIAAVLQPTAPIPYSAAWPVVFDTRTVSAPAGRTYAVVLSYQRFGAAGFNRYDGSFQTWYSADMIDSVQISSNTATLSYLQMGDGTYTGMEVGPDGIYQYDTPSNPPVVIFFDVTGY